MSLENIIVNFKDKKYNKIVNSYIINCKLESQPERVDIKEYLKFGKLDDIIEAYSNSFDANLSLDKKQIFNKNIKKLKIYEVPEHYNFNGNIASGLYDCKKNTIKLCGNNLDNEIVSEKLMHELTHMSSNKANGYLDGLTVATIVPHGYKTIGTGLNEGYTELLNCRYFAKQEHKNYYSLERKIASGFEKIVEKENMENYYFKYTLFDLIYELKKYYGDDEYHLNLMYRIDLFSSEKDYNKKVELYKNLKKEIININKHKLLKQLEKQEIDIKEFTKKNFFDIELYDKYDFTYDNYANIVDHGDKYMVMGNTGFFFLNKDDEQAKAYMKTINK